MTTLLQKPYLIKVSTKGGWGQYTQKLFTWFMDDPSMKTHMVIFVII